MRSITIMICLGLGFGVKPNGSRTDSSAMQPDSDIFDEKEPLAEKLTEEAALKILHGFREKHGIEINDAITPPEAIVQVCKGLFGPPKSTQPKFLQSSSDSHEVHAGYFPIKIDNGDHIISVTVVASKGSSALSFLDLLRGGSTTDFSYISASKPGNVEIWRADQEEIQDNQSSEPISPISIENWLATQKDVIGVLWFDYDPSKPENKAQVIYATPDPGPSTSADANAPM